MSLFLFLSLLSSAFAESWVCDGLKILDLSNGPVWFPFQSNKAEPYSTTAMHCLWKLTIPNGKYATVKVKADFDKDDMFMLYNNLGYKHLFRGFSGDLPNRINDTFYLPADSIGSFIELNTKGNGPGSLTFETQLFDVPNLPLQQISLSEQSIVPLSNIGIHRYVYSGNSEYIFRVATEDYSYRFDSCFIYEGDSVQNKFLSGLSKQVDGVPMRFTKKTTVICLGTDFPEAFMVAAPVPASMGSLSSWSIRTGQTVFFSLNSRTLYTQKYQPAYLTTYCPGGCSEYLQKVNYYNSENGTLSLYSGSPVTSLVPLESFALKESSSYVPQRMAGEWKTYLSTNGDSFAEIDKKNANFETVSDPRKGFFSSPNYGLSSSNQDSAIKFSASSGSYIFSYKVEAVSDASVLISIDQGGGKMFKQTVTPANKEIVDATRVIGQSMTMEISTTGTASKGALVSYEFVKASSSGISCLLIIIFCILRL